MSKRCKVNIKYVLVMLFCVLLSFITLNTTANGSKYVFFNSLTTSQFQDTTVKKDTSIRRDSTGKPISDSSKIDSLNLKNDTLHIKKDSTSLSKDSLDAPITYAAADSAVLLIPEKKMLLYSKSSAKYKDMDLDANNIQFDQQTQMIKAYGGTGTDTAKGAMNLPKFVQGGTTSIMDTIYFNLKTQKGLIKNTYYNEGEMFVNAQIIKKINENTGFAYKTRFTTCNYDIPHFDIKAKKVKIIKGKMAVSGPAIPEFEGVPLPIVIPFGIYPMSTGRHSGLLAPRFTSNQDFGLGLEDLGYYKVLNEHWDVLVRGNIYTYGGWNLYINPKYSKRYKYNGNLNLSIQKTKRLNSDPTAKTEFSENSSFMINWSHSSDSRARPGTSFSASVNAGSSRYNTNVPNNAMQNITNQLSSSITWSKTGNQGKYNLTVGATHNQNNNLHLQNISLPNVNFTLNTLYPFQQKESVGAAKWYEKLGLSYSGNLSTLTSFYDTAFSLAKMLDTLQWGLQNNPQLTMSLPPLGPFIISPSINYQSKWYGSEVRKTWNADSGRVETHTMKKFSTARDISFGMGLSTRIFGTFNFKNSKVKAIRHQITPTISASYKPDWSKGYYDSVQIDNQGHKTSYSYYDGIMGGPFSQGKFGGLSFSLDNLLEMKVKNSKDTTGDAPTKKVRLIDGLGVSTSYNFMADKFKWSNLGLTFRSTLFDKINITGSGQIDPYMVDSMGNRVDTLLWTKGKIGRFTGGNIALSTSFQSKSKDGKSATDRARENQTLTPDEQMRQLEYIRNNPAEFVDFNIPWNVSLSLSFNFTRQRSADYKSYYTQTTSNLSMNGDFSLTPKWKIGGNTYFDLTTQKIQMLTMYITRDMHCWQLSINVTPVGSYKSFNITINPKSGLLRDLKINRTRSFYGQ